MGLASGVDWLFDVLKSTAAAGVTVTYQRGEQQAQLTAVVGQTIFEQTDEYGIINRTESRDFLIAVEDLALDGQPIEPARGDRIIETDSTGTHTYEVMAPGDEPPWRFSDPHRQVYRIHTRQIQEA